MSCNKQVMELELKKLYDTVTSIHEEMFYLRGRQEKHFYSLKQFNETKLYIYIYILIIELKFIYHFPLSFVLFPLSFPHPVSHTV